MKSLEPSQPQAMPRETEEEMFRRVASEARREARIEQQRDFERRRQRKLERRTKREEEARRRIEEVAAKNSILMGRKANVRGRGILAKPRKRLMRSCSPIVVDHVVEGAEDDGWVPLRRDVGTETDPIETCLVQGEDEEVEDVETAQLHSAVAAEIDIDCELVVGDATDKLSKAKAAEGVEGSANVISEWERAWEKAAMEAVQHDEKTEADRWSATALLFM